MHVTLLPITKGSFGCLFFATDRDVNSVNLERASVANSVEAATRSNKKTRAFGRGLYFWPTPNV
jgi:hypothetical protein